MSPPQAPLFGPQSWQRPRPAQRAAQPAAPRVPVMPYRYAGRVLHEGRLKIYLAKGDEVFPVRKGETLDGAYRVESIDDSGITLRYLPLGRMQTIPVESALPLADAKPAPAAKPGAPGKAARVLWEGPKHVKLGAKFSVKLHVTSEQPVAASPMQVRFDPQLLEAVAVEPGRFFDQGKDQFSARVNPEGSIMVGATHRTHAPAADAEFLVLTFRPIRPAAVAELSIAALSLQGPAGRTIDVASPATFRTAITR
ncbi:MAG: cohesin domain-containing protein [Burkholderiales bacterium]|nr:cohesin domain-containing protein [Burkholderiales bacterium]